MANTKNVSLELLQYFKGKQDAANAAKFVAIEANKRLMTDAEGTKLAGIAEGAQVNVIESIVLDNSASQNSIADKVATLGMSAYALKTDVASAVHYKGTVAKYSDLPAEGMEIGDMYNVTAADAEHGVNAGDNVVWSGTAWDVLAGIVDLSGKVDKETGKSLVADTEIARLAAMSDGATKTEVSAESFTAGTKIATVTIDGTATEIKAPTVAASAAATSGVEVGSVTVNGSETKFYVAAYAEESDIDAMFAPAQG